MGTEREKEERGERGHYQASSFELPAREPKREKDADLARESKNEKRERFSSS